MLHGDQLCTDDHAYQAVRQQLRDPAWQADFLARTPEDRVAFAQDARRQSESYKQGASEAIMDVNAGAVKDAFRRHAVDLMIHGHTHRPATHELQVDGKRCERIVLGDWYTQGSVLVVSAEAMRLETLPL